MSQDHFFRTAVLLLLYTLLLNIAVSIAGCADGGVEEEVQTKAPSRVTKPITETRQ